MKLHHLIFLSTAIFTVLFYDEYIGLNFAILGVILSLFLLKRTKESNRDRPFWLLFAVTIFSCIAFAWYGDLVSFLAEFSSLLLLRFKAKNKDFKLLFTFPSFFLNCFTFIYNVFQFPQWVSRSKSSDFTKKFLAFVFIPLVFVGIFFAVYSLGSNHFSEIFTQYEWDLKFPNLVGVATLGFFFSFIFWNLLIPRSMYKANKNLKNDFSEDQKILKPTYEFLEINYERTSGVISLIALNILLLIFISTYTYEQFFEVIKTPNQLSSETHDGVNAVIMSIVMAILVILFYFKGGFNFDKEAKYLKTLTKIWILLNVVLIISTITKNTEYILNLGFTYKRLGVYAFLLLSILGLIFTYLKIKNQKTNAYLFNQMFLCFFGTICLCSFINWGGIITSENMKRKDFAENFHLQAIDFNEKQLLEYATKNENNYIKNEVEKRIRFRQTDSFLSKSIHYELFKINNGK